MGNSIINRTLWVVVVIISVVCKASVITPKAEGSGRGDVDITAAGPNQPQSEAQPVAAASTERGPEIEPKSQRDPHKKREVPKSAVDDNGKYVGLYEDDCSDTQVINIARKTAILDIDKETLGTATTCHWNIIGQENCIPALSCKKFSLEEAHGDGDDPCPGEYLEVTDGAMGYNKYCGTEGPHEVTTSRKLRDMYITLKLSPDAKIKKRELKCQVTCVEKEEGTKLPDNSEQELDEGCNCGRKPNANRIVGGEDAKKGEYPWMAALTASPTRRPFCGASVINDKFVLTAAHCFKGPYVKSKNIHVLLNAHTLDLTGAAVTKGDGKQAQIRKLEEIKELDERENTLRFTVDRYYIHPLYVRQTNDYDVALIKLDRPIDFIHNKHVSPICLPNIETHADSKEGVSAVVAGWGLNNSEAKETMGVLQKLHVNVFPESECKTFFDQRFSKRMMCAGYKEGGKDSCKGDSGGPLIAEKTKQIWEQIGIVSWGEGCAEAHSPGVYLNTREVIQWIRYISNMEGSKWCMS